MESIDDNFFAQTRERCHTWPMPQYPGSMISSQSSTPYHSPLSSGYPSTSSINNNNINQGPLPSIRYFCGQPFAQQNIIPSLPYHHLQQQQYSSANSCYNPVNFNIPLSSNQESIKTNNNNNLIVPKKEIQQSPTKSNTSQEIPCDPAPSSAAPSSSSPILPQFQTSSSATKSPTEKPKRKRIRKKDPNHVTQKKPNAWGEESYSDLILKALEAAPDGRMKLNEIYQWFIDNVKYFSERAGQEEASGWKNSIRHNLSLHSRFMRIQNEGAGKSSWWVINPDAKPGRNPRRRAQTMESTTKAKLERSRRGARKRVEMGTLRSGGSSAIGSTASIMSHEIFNDLDDPLNSNFDTFRGRTHSNLSAIGNTTRISPTVDRFDEFDFPPWGEQQRSSNPEVNEIMGRTGDMRLEGNAPDFKTDFRGIPTNDSSTLLGDFPGPKLEFDTPPYQELNPLRPPMPMQQPMMRTTFNPPRSQPMPQQMRMSNQPNGYYGPPPVYNQPMMAPPQHLNSQQQWTPINGGYQQMSGLHHTQNGQNQMFEHHQQNQLPMDLEGLSLPDTMEFGSDVETILRHELSQTSDQQIHFDL
uniref:Forkhead box protein O n=1 Tax=Panagrolaimus superbus TaxID=310955 RepID=A0A914Z654_9BILA